MKTLLLILCATLGLSAPAATITDQLTAGPITVTSGTSGNLTNTGNYYQFGSNSIFYVTRHGHVIATNTTGSFTWGTNGFFIQLTNGLELDFGKTNTTLNVVGNVTATKFSGDGGSITNMVYPVFGSLSANQVLGTNGYYYSVNGNQASSSASWATTPMPISGTIGNLYVYVASAIGPGTNIGFTLTTNGAATSIVSGVSSNVTQSLQASLDTTHTTLSLPAGTRIGVWITNNHEGTINTTYYNWSFTITH